MGGRLATAYHDGRGDDPVVMAVLEVNPVADTDAFSKALAAFNAAHDQDPQRRHHAGSDKSVERVWCDNVAKWVARLAPRPSLALKIAAHAQHLERWRDPRSAWPAGRAGYLRWRKAQQRRHAERAEEILLAAG